MNVEDAWRRIFVWCQTQAPQTAEWVSPAAPAPELHGTSSLFPRGWPSDLVAFYQLQDGMSPEAWRHDGLLLGWTVLSLDAVRGQAREQNDTAQDLFDADDLAASDREPAGTPSPFWLPSMVPVAEGVAANVLCVDTRPGPESGCLVEFDEDGSGSMVWSSTNALLDATATALETGASDGGPTPVVIAKELRWTDAAPTAQPVSRRTVGDGWHVVSALSTEHAVLRWEREEPQPLHLQGRDWNRYEDVILDRIENLRVQMLPPERWPEGFGAELESDLGELRIAQRQMSANDKVYFDGLADVLRAMLDLSQLRSST